jgi:hypothetical protein
MFQTKLYVDEAWMKRLSFGLKRFHKVKKDVHACRCPFCGDSKKSSTKTRFYFYVRKSTLLTQCKNCGYSRSFFNFVSDYSPDSFEEYKKETLLHSFTKGKKEEPKQDTSKLLNQSKPKTLKDAVGFKRLKNTIPCIDLPEDHVAKVYLYKRGFQKAQIEKLLYTDDFKSVASQLDREASVNLLENEPRIVIPFYDSSGRIKLIQGRALKETKMKYITIKIDDDVDKTYGLESLDASKTSYCVEGPLDSLFVDNCIATCDANLIRSDADVLIFDNQPRNKDVVNYMQQAIKEGRSIVIWPNSPDGKQDINDMVKSGVTPELLMRVIRKCTYRGITAQLKFNQWKKV